eukprot:m.24067 g.24067  ORF g.24067 m.24067 type:complete len:889 (+) comp11470_c0_seq3:91-2757(+)
MSQAHNDMKDLSVSVAVGEEWICDQCTAINSSAVFPCHLCGYPLNVTSQETDDDHEFEGTESGTFVALTAPTAHPGKSGLHTAQDDVTQADGATLPHGLKPLDSLEQYICPVCCLASKEPPCVLCGFDPASDEAPELQDDSPDFETDDIAAGINVVEYDSSADVGAVQLHAGGYRFRVYAPNAKLVELYGEFHFTSERAWSKRGAKGTTAGLVMERESDEEHWRLIVPEAKVGQKYRYRIHFSCEVDRPPRTPSATQTKSRLSQALRASWRSDPRARILSPDEQYPHLMNAILYDNDHFQWEDQAYKAPKLNQLVLYELHPATFAVPDGSAHGDLFEAARRLDYLKQLGVSGVCLMPVSQDWHPHADDDQHCWGYDPMSLFAIQLSYGGPDALKHFVNEAHRRDIAVIFDFVPNHMAYRNVLQWFDGTNLYFAEESTEWGPRPDFSQPRVRDYIIDAALSYFRDFHMDGIRVDSTSNIRGVGHDIPGGWQLLQELNDAVHEYFPSAVSIAEDLYDDHRLNSGGACFDLQWCQGSFHALFQVATAPSDAQRDIEALAHHIEHPHPGPMAGRIVFTENHDTVPGDRERRMPLAITRGIPEADPTLNFFAVRRSAMVAAVAFSMPGVPMILQGQECLEIASPEWPIGPFVDWSRCRTSADNMLLYKRLIAMRSSDDGTMLGLTGLNVRVHHMNKADRVFAYHRWSKGGPGDDVQIIVNASNKTFKKYRIGVPRSGEWNLKCTTADSHYSSVYSSQDDPLTATATASPDPRDGYPFSVVLSVPRYSVAFYAQESLSIIRFRVVCRATDFGDTVAISGSARHLGAWQLPVNLMTTPTQFPVWNSELIRLPVDREVTFKIVIVRSDGTRVWERRGNRTFVPVKGKHVLMLSFDE